jgi:hypothetical protein
MNDRQKNNICVFCIKVGTPGTRNHRLVAWQLKKFTRWKIHMKKILGLRWIFLLAAASLVGCGGGSSSSSSSSGNILSGVGAAIFGASPSITGSAATGAPIANAKVFVVDSQGKTPAGQDEAAGVALTTTDANGVYKLTSTMLSGLTAPFMVRVVGEMVTDTGDKGAAVFHAIVNGSGASVANITPLTEAHAALTLGAQPALTFGTANALAGVTNEKLAAANTKLADALAPVVDFSSKPNFVGDALDATPGASLSSDARKHDATLDQLSVSVSDGKIILADRNQDDATFSVGPRVVVSAATQQVSLPAGAISAKPAAIDLPRVKAFATRFSTQLAAGCVVDTEPTAPTAGNCDAVTNVANKVFNPRFKDKGMNSWRWLSGWLTDAFENPTLTGVSVSVISSNLGSFVADDGQRVYRVLLKFTKDADVVIRPMLLVDDQTTVTAYGNQKDFFFYIAPRFNYKRDASNIYPNYPQYELGLSMTLKHWYGGQNFAIFGASITGPGLPASRQGVTMVNGLLGGTDVNRNRLAAGIEVFDRRAFGCSAFAIENSVYVERNTTSWANRGDLSAGNIRLSSGATTCSPMFDMLRYDSGRDITSTGFSVPKKGDAYTVTLYLDPSKFAPNTSLAIPAGTGAATIIKNSDGVSKSVLPYSFTYIISADGFALPTASFNPSTFGFPGVSDTTRSNLAKLAIADDLSITWTRSKTTLADGTVFGSFYAGRYMNASDQYRSTDSGVSGAFTYDDGTSAMTNYNAFITSNAANCGLAANDSYRNGLINVYPLIKRVVTIGGATSYTATTCAGAIADKDAAAAADTASTYTVVYYNQRVRKLYASDRGRLVATSDTSQVLRFSDLIARETTGNFNLCSAYNGFFRLRQVYVMLSDFNGRQLMEMREVWWDYPNNDKNVYAAGDPSAVEAGRPFALTDPLYLANTSIGKTNYAGEKGFVHTVKYKTSIGGCADKAW